MRNPEIERELPARPMQNLQELQPLPTSTIPVSASDGVIHQRLSSYLDQSCHYLIDTIFQITLIRNLPCRTSDIVVPSSTFATGIFLYAKPVVDSSWAVLANEQLTRIQAIAESENKKIPNQNAIAIARTLLSSLQNQHSARVDRLVAEAGGGVGLYAFCDSKRARIAIDNDGDAIVSISGNGALNLIEEFDPFEPGSLQRALELFGSIS